MTAKNFKRQNSIVVALVIAALLMTALTVSIRLGHYFQSLEVEANKFQPYQDLYRSLAGYDSPQKTLLVLANNAEIRTGGGFIGTLGLINSNQGKIKADPLVGVYSIDSPDFCRDKNYSQPDYLAVNLIDCSSLRDSSNYLDFPSNAKRVMYFYQLNTSIGVNNVVQITPEVLETLLDKLGPVYLKDYNLTVTKDNFRDSVQLEVEAGKDKLQKKDPKSGVLGNLSNVLVSRLLSKDIIEIKNILPNIQDLIDQKQIVIYSSDPQTEVLIRKIGAAGELSKTDENYFMISEANFAANKSSPYIKNTVNMHQTILADGSSQVDLEIVTNHTSPNRISYIDPNTNKLMWLVGEDKSYITIALPDDTQLNSANVGSRPYFQKIENGKLLLSYYRYIQPLSQNKVTLSYKVPTKYLFGDRLVINSLVQKQLGGWPYTINYSLTLPSDEYELTASSVKDIKKQVGNGNTVFYTGNVDQDQVLSFIYEKP
jgi:hypothetical protein